MDRFNGYNRHDFHHPRTTREAFGSAFHVTKKPNKAKEIAIWVGYVVFIISLMLLIQGYGR
jgi:hypothetical protein